MTDPTPSGLPQPQTVAIINGEPATAHSMLAALIDIYDDAQNNAPEHRCYVESAWADVLKEARTFLASAPAVETVAVQEALAKALERMDRARAILTDGNPRPECNWGLLDTSDLRVSPLPVAPKAEPEINSYDAACIYCWNNASAQPVGADTLTDDATAVDLWAEIWRLRAAVKGPEGYATWQDAATAERIRRVKAQRSLASPPRAIPAEQAAPKLVDPEFPREGYDRRSFSAPAEQAADRSAEAKDAARGLLGQAEAEVMLRARECAIAVAAQKRTSPANWYGLVAAVRRLAALTPPQAAPGKGEGN